ncbi:MAG: ferritin family protein [Candidatus Thorarchaeota archaeon]
MSKGIKVVRTVNNLMTGFIRESQNRTRYELYADVARKEKNLLISRTFKEFADQNKEHAIVFYKLLRKLKKDEVFEDLLVEIKSPSTYGTTIENLNSSINEKDEIWEILYPNFADIAKKEGYIEIANKFKEYAQAERNSSQRLKMFLNLIRSNSFTEKNTITFWKCLACGYEVAVDELKNDFECPSCGHLKSYFQRKILHLSLDKKTIGQKEITGWVCMECGYEVGLEELPDDWKCSSCGRSKAYFKRKALKHKEYKIESISSEKARWVCLECGNEEEIDLPIGWKCSKCGFPKK